MKYILNNKIGARSDFLREQRSETYIGYGETSTAVKKADIAQEAFQNVQLCCTTGKAGL